MQPWEYMILVDTMPAVRGEELDWSGAVTIEASDLNGYGAEGWELMAATAHVEPAYYVPSGIRIEIPIYRYVFKRQIE